MSAVVVEPEKTPADKLEGVAFQFCKIATVSLLAGRYVFPVSAGLCACLYFAAHIKGKRESRCVLRYSLLIGAFWLIMTIGWFFLTYWPAVQHLVISYERAG